MTWNLTKTCIAAAFATTILPGTALATQQCGERDLVVNKLAATYGESRRGYGLAANQTLMEVYASDETGSWTITVTMPNGTTCMIASGQHYEAVKGELPASGTKS